MPLPSASFTSRLPTSLLPFNRNLHTSFQLILLSPRRVVQLSDCLHAVQAGGHALLHARCRQAGRHSCRSCNCSVVRNAHKRTDTLLVCLAKCSAFMPQIGKGSSHEAPAWLAGCTTYILSNRMHQEGDASAPSARQGTMLNNQFSPTPCSDQLRLRAHLSALKPRPQPCKSSVSTAWKPEHHCCCTHRAPDLERPTVQV